MNYIPQVAKMLGVEIGEEFKIKQVNGDRKTVKYRFREVCNEVQYERQDGLYSGNWTMCSAKELGLLVLGRHKIEKLPFFEPKMGEKYFTVSWIYDDEPWISSQIWYGDPTDCIMKAIGNVFCTRAEAEAHKYEIYEKLKGKKWKGEDE